MDPVVGENRTVSFEFTLTVDGVVVDHTPDDEPVRYVHGSGQLLPGLERGLAGLRVNERRDILVPPEEGFGHRDPSALLQVPASQFPETIRPEIGKQVGGTANGKAFRATIADVKDETVTLDTNHPLAGKHLRYAVHVVAIAPGPSQQAEHAQGGARHVTSVAAVGRDAAR